MPSIIQKLKQNNRLQITILLFFMTLFCFALSATRIKYTGSVMFLFLIWNLFLAFIPWLLSSTIVVFNLKNKFFLIILIITWLLFFPNSPYILTDLFHLRLKTTVPKWYDLILILSFAWTGLVYGFISLMDIENLLVGFINKKLLNLISILFLFLASFGIYLGRFLRWNSWDVINKPSGLINDITERFTNPFDHPTTWGVTILMGVLLNMMYFSLKFIRN